MMKRSEHRIHSATAAFAVVFGGAVSALAATDAAFQVADYVGFLALGLALLLGGLGLARTFTSWWDLDKRWRVARFVGVPLAALGVFILVFAAVESPPVKGEGLPWLHQYDQGLEQAKQTSRPMMVDFTADWCGACKELEAEVFHHDDVRGRLATEYVLVKVDLDEPYEPNQKAFAEQGFSGLPAVAFVSASGETLKEPTFEGKLTVEEFQERLDAVESGTAVGDSRGEFQRTLEEEGLLAALLLVFLAGVLASLTPCVYPLIPITVGIFGAKQADTRLHGFGLSLVYAFGIAVTYSVLGVAAASLGTVFGGAMQNPWVLGAISLLFLVLGLSSLGVFEIRLPGSLQTKLSQTGGAGWAGAFVMGLVAGIIAAPCVGPIVAGILLYVAQQQDPVLGFGLLFTFAIGMGQLFLALGTFSSLLNRLPQSGSWMEGVKLVFGVVFIAMALYYLQFLAPAIADVAEAVWLLVG
jgi:thiol:disulfide interchange protein